MICKEIGENGIMKCEVCAKTFSKKLYLRRHKQNIHGSPKFHCPICGRYFKLNHHLKKHLERHEFRKLSKNEADCFHCDKCVDKWFRRKDLLRKHIKNVHGEKKFDCNFCGKKFTVKCNMEKHIKVIHKKQMN